MADGLVLAVPSAVLELVQQGLLERAFHDGLFPGLHFRADAMAEEWPLNSGTEAFQTRAGTLTPITEPLTPGQDPTPQAISYEQWVVRMQQFGGTINTHMPTSAVAHSDLLLRNIHSLGLQAGQSINQIARNELFKAYLGGSTVLSEAVGSSGNTTIKVASVNGFTEVITKGTNVRPVPVSSANPLPILIGTTAKNVIGVSLEDPNDPNGPGTLYLSATVGSTPAARTSVLSSARPRILRAGGGTSVDALTAGDVVTLQDFITGVNFLREMNVQPHDDGLYHVHLPAVLNTQMFADPVYQRLHQSLPESDTYKRAFIGPIAGMMFVLNNESPLPGNSGTRTATGTNAYYSKGIGAETTNEGGLTVARAMITGKGSFYERYLDESAYVSEAGVNGKIGQFDIVNNGIGISMERIRLILRAPINLMQDMVAATWSATLGFPVPSDVTSGGAERYKRALVIEAAAA